MNRDFIVADELSEFRRYKELAERAIVKLPDAALFRCIGDESNSIAMLMKHVSGNLRSRWTDFFSSDGEKLDRKRDTEFVIGAADTREALLDRWNQGWQILFDVLEALTADDMKKTVAIRAEPYTVPQAILRSLAHCAYHAGQIVLLAKYFAGSDWEALTVPRGKSDEYFAEMREKMRNKFGAKESAR